MAKTRTRRRRAYPLARAPRARVVTRRVGPSPKMVRAQTSQAAKRARKRAMGQAEKDRMWAVGASLVLGVLARKGIEVPMLGEVGTAAGVGLAMFAAPFVVDNALTQRLAAVSVGPLSVAAHELGEESDLLDFLD